MTGGEITARRGQAFQIVAGGKLRRIVGRMIRRLRGQRTGHREHGERECGNRPAIETKGKHHDEPSSRSLWRDVTESRCYRQSRTRTLTVGIKPFYNAAFGAPPHGYRRA